MTYRPPPDATNDWTFKVILRRRIAYALDNCPRCGSVIAPPDDELVRLCSECRISVHPNDVTWEESGE